MEAKELTKNKKMKTKVQLVKGDFSPVEASQIILSLINEKINFHKIERLQIWEGNHNCETEPLDKRIEELENEKIIAKEIIEKAKRKGQQIKINGVLEITLLHDANA